VSALAQRVDSLETANRTLKMEWEDVYDKMHKAAQRLNARTRRDTREKEPPAADDVIEPALVQAMGSHQMLEQARARRGKP